MQRATTSHNHLQCATTNHNRPQQTTTTHKEPQRSTSSHNEPQKTTIPHNEPQRTTTTHNKPQQLKTTTPEIIQYIQLSSFYGLSFLILDAFLFSFSKLELHTYHNSCLPSDLTKIKTSSAALTLFFFIERLIILYCFPKIVSLFLFFKC